jgi:hypothetical protein
VAPSPNTPNYCPSEFIYHPCINSFICCTKVKAFNRRSLLVNIFLHKLVLRPTATATFSIFLIHTSSNNEDIFLQHHRSIPSNEENLSNKNKPRKSIIWSNTGLALDCSGSQEELQTTTKNDKQQLQTATDDQHDIFLRSLLRGTPSPTWPKRDKTRATF